MEEEQETIASAVEIPPQSPDDGGDADSPQSLSSPRFKRRLSPSPPATKRPRHDDAIPPRRRGANGNDEEKRRGKRLFGALLGTIGKFQQDSSSARARAGAVKRREVEDKLREKLKAQTEEIDERIKMEDENVNLRRRVEQRVFDERAMQIRHENLLSQAYMLCTNSTPKLYYLPWKLSPTEEQRIKQQVVQAQELVEKESREFQHHREADGDPRHHANGNGTSSYDSPTNTRDAPAIADGRMSNLEVRERATPVEDVDVDVDAAPEVPATNIDNTPPGELGATASQTDVDLADAAAAEEAGEDTVIY